METSRRFSVTFDVCDLRQRTNHNFTLALSFIRTLILSIILFGCRWVVEIKQHVQMYEHWAHKFFLWLFFIRWFTNKTSSRALCREKKYGIYWKICEMSSALVTWLQNRCIMTQTKNRVLVILLHAPNLKPNIIQLVIAIILNWRGFFVQVFFCHFSFWNICESNSMMMRMISW